MRVKDNINVFFYFTEEYLSTRNTEINKNLLMINLQNYETITHQNFLNRVEIWWIKTNKKNKCIIISSYGFFKGCLVDF